MRYPDFLLSLHTRANAFVRAFMPAFIQAWVFGEWKRKEQGEEKDEGRGVCHHMGIWASLDFL